MKQLLLALFCASSIVSLTAVDLVVGQQGLFVPNKLGSLEVVKTKQGFQIIKGDARHKVDTDEMLKKLNKKQLAKFLNTRAGYIAVSQLDNGDYRLNAKVRGLGGGPGGATVGFIVGKATVQIVGHGTIGVIAGVVGVFNPIAGTAVGYALEAALALPIEVASNTIGLASGIALGAATGPA